MTTVQDGAMTGHPLVVQRMRSFQTTVFAEMTVLAAATGALNLGQGFPDSDGPPEVLDAAQRAIAAGRNQYPPGRGVPELRRAIAEHQHRHYGLTYDPDTEVLVTAGATEAMTATILALCEPGDEIVVLEPTYDAYVAAAALAGAVVRPVRLEHPDYRLDADLLAATVTDRTRLIIVNTPHNPSGRVLDDAECRAVADVAQRHDVVVVTDEVYEHLTFDGARHHPLSALPGMAARTVQISSAGKTFAVTGWKIGWLCAPAALVTAVLTVKQWLTFVGGGPFQYAVAEGLALPDDRLAAIRDTLQAGRDQLLPALRAAGFEVQPSQAGYFLTADVGDVARGLGYGDSVAFCRALPELCGVVAVPSLAFYVEPAGVEMLVRFAFCKRPAVLTEAADRLAGLRSR